MSSLQHHLDLLRDRNRRLQGTRIVDLLGAEPRRLERFSAGVAGLHVDFSRHLLDREALELLLGLADAARLEVGRQRLLTGAVVNDSEGRGADHARLRDQGAEATLVQLERIVSPLREGRWRGASGEVIDHLVNIGIGGSDLGPRLVVDALASADDPVRVDFLANIDGEAVEAVLRDRDPARTAFCVTSKSFGTEETRSNALGARAWLRERLGTDEVGDHFVAITSRVGRARDFGVNADRILPMDDEIGGRFSLWSCVGLPIAAAVGLDAFGELLRGGRAMDRHFAERPFATNLPVLLALLGIWYRNVAGVGTWAVVPYDRRLRLLPAWLQQLDMESCGKRVDRQGRAVDHATGAVVWGGEGTKGQHAFFQWLHQGTDPTPVDLIAAATPRHDREDHHRKLLANLVGQATALMLGRDEGTTRDKLRADGLDDAAIDALAPHCTFPGNRPSTVMIVDALTPRTLGSLLALHEHRVFCQGWLWGINPFDQWGVELGKTLATTFDETLADGSLPDGVDPATADLLQRLRRP